MKLYLTNFLVAGGIVPIALHMVAAERCEGGHRTAYAGRREADVVMASLRVSPSLSANSLSPMYIAWHG